MHVLHVVNYGWPYVDGYTVRTAGLVTAQRDELGWSPHVLTSPFMPFAAATDEDFTTSAWGPHNQTTSSGTVAGWERPGVGLAPVSSRTLREDVIAAATRHHADLVHVHHPHQVARPAIAGAHELGLPVVHEVRCFNGDYDLDRAGAYTTARGRWANHLEVRAARSADAAVTIADGLARRLRDADVAPVDIVRNAVDTNRFAPDGPVADRPDVRLHLGYATTFAHIEGLDLLVEAVAVARPRLAAGDLHVTLAGVGPDRDRIMRLAADLDVDDLLSFPGFVPVSRMPAFDRSLDAFVVTRHDAAVARDTTPLKPLEALAVGTPVWSADLPAMRELLGDHPGTRLFPPTAAALADVVVAAVADPPERVTPDLDERSWSHEVHRYAEVYGRLVRGVAA